MEFPPPPLSWPCRKKNGAENKVVPKKKPCPHPPPPKKSAENKKSRAEKVVPDKTDVAYLTLPPPPFSCSLFFAPSSPSGPSC